MANWKLTAKYLDVRKWLARQDARSAYLLEPKAQDLCRYVAIALTIIFIINCLRMFWVEARLSLLASYDIGWLVSTGDYILKNHVLPSHDCFSWTSSDCRQVLY